MPLFSLCEELPHESVGVLAGVYMSVFDPFTGTVTKLYSYSVVYVKAKAEKV